MNAETLAEKIGAEMLDTIERNKRIVKADLVEAAKRVIEQEKPYWLAMLNAPPVTAALRKFLLDREMEHAFGKDWRGQQTNNVAPARTNEADWA
jgi:hypothetical protein